MAVVWASAMAPIGPLAWELPYAIGATLKKKKKEKNEKLMLVISVVEQINQ